MVQLFLSKPEVGDRGDKDAVKGRISFLQRLESIIWSVITSGVRNEARLWLCNTISHICSITSRGQRELFVELLRSTPSKWDVAAQLLQLIIAKSPQKIGSVLAKRGYLLEEFFKGNPRRIMRWFDHFAVDSESRHKKGARAISQFAFINRDICWEELVWLGKHGQSPAVIATKPHYFHELDILQTVENFLEYVPDFWSSEELAASMKDGEILSIDTHFFVDCFLSLMYGEKSADIWTVIDDFLIEEEFSFLSQRLLILLDERELRAFLNSICKFIQPSFQCKDFQYPSFWLEILLLSQEDHVPLDEFLLLNSIINSGRHLLRLLADEEHEEEREKIEKLLRTSIPFCNADHWALLEDCVQMKPHVSIKLVGLQAWILHYILSKECKSQGSCESLFACNGIGFHKSDNYSLVQSDGFSRRSGSKIDEDEEDGDGYKMGRAKKKRKRSRHDYDQSKGDELVEFETSYGYDDVQLLGGSWFLSTDGYACQWNAADLPEQLSRHCFSTWMKGVFSNFLT